RFAFCSAGDRPLALGSFALKISSFASGELLPLSQPLPKETKLPPSNTIGPRRGINRACRTPRVLATRATTPAFVGQSCPTVLIGHPLGCGENPDGEPAKATHWGRNQMAVSADRRR